MSNRLHLVLAAAEKERFRRMAVREGKTLSAWVRDAARDRAAAIEAEDRLDTPGSLEGFFEECDARESGREPDWQEHERVIRDSQSSGGSGT